jgi:FMN-dependent NADH-azoreductase
MGVSQGKHDHVNQWLVRISTIMSNPMEHQESYLKTVFVFLGVTDVRFVHAEGLGMGMGDAAKNAAVTAAGVEVHVQVKGAANQEALAALAALAA